MPGVGQNNYTVGGLEVRAAASGYVVTMSTAYARVLVIAAVGESALLDALVHMFVADGCDVRGAGPLDLRWRPDLVVLTQAAIVGQLGGPRAAAPNVPLLAVVPGDGSLRELRRDLNVQAVHPLSDGDDRLLLLADTLIDQHRVVERLDLQRRGLLHIVDFGPRITRLQPMDGLFHAALEEVQPLLGGGQAFIATENSGLFVFDGSTEGVVVRAGTGRFAGMTRVGELDPPAQAAVAQALASDLALVIEDGFVLIPMRTRDGERGCIVIEGPLSPEAGDLCRIYGQQVGQALENLSLWDRATTDGLTRLHNRTFGAQRLEETRSLDVRQVRPTSVLMIDIDRFKSVNDTFGHAAGDSVLKAVASAIHGVGRRSDVIARWGGEEFLMVLPETSLPQALLAGERVRRAVSGLQVIVGEDVVRTTASIGVATAPAGDSRSAETLVADADRALYLAKNAGRDQVCQWPA